MMLTDRLIEHRPPRIAMALILVAAACHWLLSAPVLFTARGLAVPVGIAGFVIMIWAWWQFQRQRVAICPTAHTRYLITDGIYRLTRNPMYLGILLMLCGIAIWFGTLPFMAAAAAFYIVIDRAFRPYEERKLEDTFGEKYTAYQRRVRSWL